MYEMFYFVFVGSGGGSMCAALLMHSVGKRPLILEKTDLVGGSTAMSGGVMWIPNNRFLAAAGVKDSHEAAATYLDALAGPDVEDVPGGTRERRLTYLAEAPRMIDFLVDQGVKLERIPYWPDYYDELPGGLEAGRTVIAELFDANELGEWKDRLRKNYLQLPVPLDEAMKVPRFKTTSIGKKMMARVVARTLHAKLTGKRYVTAGAALQGRMLKAALKAGVPIRTNAGVKELLTDATGAVVGVLAVIDGEERRIGAHHGVLINAGGFSRNQRMRDAYQPGTSTKWTNANPGDTGEMIEEAMRVGGAIAQMEEMVGCQIALPPGHTELLPMVQGDVSSPHSIIVDQTGVRYMREAQSYMKFCQDMFARDKIAPAVPSWLVMDSQYLRKYMLAGSMPGTKKPKAWFDSGFLRKGATVEDLARACEMDPAKLTASVERFNGFVHKGVDEDFGRGGRAYDRYLGDAGHRYLGDEGHRPSASLGPVDQGPFYAVQIFPGDVGTYGGLVTDSSARVLRKDGSVIPGLYATGTSTASVMGRSYPGAGSSLGPSFTFGYVAAKHAANAGNLAP